MSALTRTSSSSVPAPADVSGGGTEGTMASGLAEMRCSASLMNSEWRRRTSRYCVVLKAGRFVCDVVSGSRHVSLFSRGSRTCTSNLKIGSLRPVRSRPVILAWSLNCGGGGFRGCCCSLARRAWSGPGFGDCCCCCCSCCCCDGGADTRPWSAAAKPWLSENGAGSSGRCSAVCETVVLAVSGLL